MYQAIIISVIIIIISYLWIFRYFKAQIKKLEEDNQRAKEIDCSQENLNQINFKVDNAANLLKAMEEQIEEEKETILLINQQIQEKNADLILLDSKLEKINATYQSRMEAERREMKMQQEKDFYKLHLNDKEQSDIQILNNIKSQLFNSRILSMLIWSTYFQKQMTTLCNNILGINKISGIYKITNIKDNKCYIGQSVDIATRFKNHAKCGLGIDTPANNKLYQAMEKEGLENFTWELLEKCPKEQLNEKEKYYIKAYQAVEYGYNSSQGISTKGE